MKYDRLIAKQSQKHITQITSQSTNKTTSKHEQKAPDADFYVRSSSHLPPGLRHITINAVCKKKMKKNIPELHTPSSSRCEKRIIRTPL